MGKLKEKLFRLLKLNNTPPEIALGVALGVFISCMPVYGLHTVLVILLALIIPRANKIAILLGTNFSIPVTLPFITWAGYDIGRGILKNGCKPLTIDYFMHFNFKNLGDFYYPLFVGSIVLGIFCAISAYFITYYFAQKIKEKKSRRAPAQNQNNISQ